MERVKVTVKGAGSLEVSGDAVAKEIIDFIGKHLEEREYIVTKIKRGPKKKVKSEEAPATGA